MPESDAKSKITQTIDYYDREAENWSRAHHGDEQDSYWFEEMNRFHELLPTGKILEVGSGTGKDAAALISMGYDYVGTDASKGLLQLAKKRNPKATFHHKAVEELDFPDGSFDGFWTAATLLHIPKDKVDNALSTLGKQVRSRGIGFISVKQGEGEKIDEPTGRLFSFYSKDEFSGILVRNGYEVVESKVKPTEGETTWLIYFVKKQ